MSQITAADIVDLYEGISSHALAGGYTQKQLKTLHESLVGTIKFMSSILSDIESQMEDYGK